MKLKFKDKIFAFLKNNRKDKMIFLGGLFLIPLLICSFSSFFAHIASNKSQSLAEVSEKYKKAIGEEPATIIYGQEIFSRSYELLSIEPEKSKEMRSVFEKQVCFNGYLKNWDNTYSPIKTSINGSDAHFSLLLWPKSGYRDSRFMYNMPLIAGHIDNHSNSHDIYITKTYAEYLIGNDYDSNYENRFEIFLRNNTNITFEYEVKNIQSSNFFVTYNLKGIIDDLSDEYLKYKSYFGDYFIANQYLSLPIPHFTYFETTNGLYSKWAQINTILSIYNYTASRMYNSALITSYAYEYRIGFAGELDSDYNINQILGDNDLAIETANIFNEFSDGKFLTPMLTSFCLSLFFTSLIVCIFYLLRKRNFFQQKEGKKNQKFYNKMLVIFLFCVFSTIGFCLLNVMKLVIPSLSFLSVNSPFIAICLIILLLIFYFILFSSRKTKKKKHNKIDVSSNKDVEVI